MASPAGRGRDATDGARAKTLRVRSIFATLKRNRELTRTLALMAEVTTNRAIENAAIQYVLAYEAAQGRIARDTRGKGAPADVESNGRVIEVKAAGGSARGADLWLEARQVHEAESNANFWLYVVENVRQGDPALFRLILLGGEQLARLLAKKKALTTYTVPFPVAEFDTAPRGTMPAS